MATLSTLILAAGKGTRMRSSQAKVMHPIADKPMLQHVIETARELTPIRLAVVSGQGAEQVVPLAESLDAEIVMQTEQLGTGHAVMQAMTLIEASDQLLVLYGDVPLTQAATLQSLVDCGDAESLRILTFILDDPTGYGRIVRNDAGDVTCITEQKDADVATLAINEVNSGIMVLPCGWLQSALSKLSNQNAQGEYYLTDLVALAVAEGVAIATVCCADDVQVAGVNNRQQLANLEREYQKRQAVALMAQGVTLLDPMRFDVRGSVEVGEDITIDVNVILAGKVVIGDNVKIGANCVITDAVIGAGTEILPNCVLEDCRIGANTNIGPFARIRPGTVLANEAKIGNFVETKNANIGLGSKVNHLSYIGDTDMGAGVNIGAGTITCNYDGANKHRTTIGDNAFIGSDSQLIAPVTVGEGATVAAGTTLRKDAPADALTLTKSDQRSLTGWKRPVKQVKMKQDQK